MTFFYDLNKKLDTIREKPELKHGQLNERDMGKHNNGKTTGFKAVADKAAKEYGSKAAGERVAGAVKAKMAKAGKLEETDLDEGLGDMARKVGGMAKKVGQKALDTLGHGSDEDMIRNLQKKAGVPQTGKKPEPAKEGVDKQAFAALAPPKDKITFADKIAGAKKEVDEMLGDVAAEAMKAALSPKQKKIDMNKNGKLDANDFAMLRKGGKGKEETDEGWDDMLKDVERRRSATKKGEITHGHKHDIEDTGTGRRVTRRTDPNTGYSVGSDDDDDKPADGEKRGRGRPKGSKKAMGAKGPSGKSKLMTKEGSDEGSDLVKLAKVIASCQTRDQLLTAQKMANNFLKKHQAGGFSNMKQDMSRLRDVEDTLQQKNRELKGEKELDEKAVSKKQQRFMGMVHATQKGEKAPSKEVAKVAKSMKKSDAEDFAATKHKGLPEKKKPEAKSDAPKKKKEKTEEAGGTGTPTASSGFSFGKGIYDSMNHELETMIAEGMNISMNMNSDANGGPGKSLTITATDEDALKLSALLKSAGLGSGDDQGYGGEGYKSACGCGTPDCSCGEEEMDEAYGDNVVSQNEPNWPTNTERAEDNLEYAGGLNKPKSTGQSTVPVLASQEERQGTYAEAEEDAIKRMMEMAGIKEAKKPDANKDGIPDYAQDGKGSKDLGKAKDKEEKKVDEGILSATANLWTEYKGHYGV